MVYNCQVCSVIVMGHTFPRICVSNFQGVDTSFSKLENLRISLDCQFEKVAANILVGVIMFLWAWCFIMFRGPVELGNSSAFEPLP